MIQLFTVVINHQNRSKRLFAEAITIEEAVEKFHRHLVCQWVGFPWGDDSNAFLDGVFDKLTDGGTIK